jgi:hypothetical protein
MSRVKPLRGVNSISRRWHTKQNRKDSLLQKFSDDWTVRGSEFTHNTMSVRERTDTHGPWA